MTNIEKTRQAIGRLPRWIYRCATWIFYAPLTLFILGFCLAGLPIYLEPTEYGIKSSGVLLQLLGILIPAMGISKTRKHFKAPGHLEMYKAWLKARPRLWPVIVEATGHVELGLSSRAIGSSPLHGTCDEKIAQLKQEVDQLYTTLVTFEESHQADMKHERALNDAAHQESRTRDEWLEKAQISGLLWAEIVAIYLTLGVIVSAFPAEILKLVS